MLNCDQLRELIIKPTLSQLQMYSDFASELLVFTCACESHGGTYLQQVKGVALGIYQMEPATYNDLWQNFIRNRSNILMLLSTNFECYRMPPEDRMIYDLNYATAMARIHYRRSKKPFPNETTPDTLWDYYKEVWNTKLGKAKKDKAIKAYKEFIQVPD